jgi:phospholipid-transporting ATPase
MKKRMDVHRYIRFEGEIGAVRWLIQLLTYWVAYSHMIPISLYVIIEVLKLGQAKLINNDVKMFFPEDMKYALCRNSDLIEELGQVEFVFSDKTGTLTQNKMEFKKAYVSTKVLGTPTEDDPELFEGMSKTSVDEV